MVRGGLRMTRGWKGKGENETLLELPVETRILGVRLDVGNETARPHVEDLEPATAVLGDVLFRSREEPEMRPDTFRWNRQSRPAPNQGRVDLEVEGVLGRDVGKHAALETVDLEDSLRS